MKSIVMRISAGPLVLRTRSNVRTINCRSGRKRLSFATIVELVDGKRRVLGMPATRLSVSGSDGIEQ
jgi:hypothetical protein